MIITAAVIKEDSAGTTAGRRLQEFFAACSTCIQCRPHLLLLERMLSVGMKNASVAEYLLGMKL